jgi:hypothetical protein
MTGMKLSFLHDTFTIQFPRDVAGPLDRLVARAFVQSLDKGGLVELIHLAAETLAARNMSQVDRVMFERWQDELRADGESPQQAFSKVITDDETGRLLYQAMKIAPGADIIE